MHKPVLAGLAVAVSLATAAGGCRRDRFASCSDAVDLDAPVLSNGFAADLSNTGNHASQINASNVATLKLALRHAADGSKEKRGAPAVTRQAVFFSAGRRLIAMNRVSGCQYWSYSIPDIKTPLVGDNAVRSSSVSYLPKSGANPPLVLAGDFFGNFYAVHAGTGQLLWSEFVGTDPKHHMITGGSQVYGGKLFVPVASKEVITALIEFGEACCRSHGMLQALDPYTGKVLWSYHTAPEATLDPTTKKYAPNGMSVWSPPTIDPARRTVYIGTGQNYTPPTTANEDAIVALDMDSGTPKWVFQGTSGDAWNTSCQAPLALLSKNCLPAPPGGTDVDFGAPPMLVHLAGGRDAVIAGEKSGMLYSLDPDTGRPNWSVRVGAGGNIGGIHWGIATDGARVYVGVSDVTVDKVTGLNADSLFHLRDLVGNNIHQSVNATPGVYAVDLATGKVVWARHPTHTYTDKTSGTVTVPSIYSAGLAVTNDVVFAASLDGVVKAFRAIDGNELWSYSTAITFVDVNGTAGNGGTIDSVGPVPAGTDLLVNSGFAEFGGTNRYQAGTGNALFIFRLAGS